MLSLLRIKLSILFFLIILSSHTATQKSGMTSLLYNEKGQLIADTSYRISKQQLKKFSKSENIFTKQVLDSLKITPVFLENGIPYEVIISFTVDEHSCFSNLRIEKINTKYSSVEKLIRDLANTMFINPVLQNSCKGYLKANKKKCDKYYLPIKFDCDKNLREINKGWLFYQISCPPIIDKYNQY